MISSIVSERYFGEPENGSHRPLGEDRGPSEGKASPSKDGETPGWETVKTKEARPSCKLDRKLTVPLPSANRKKCSSAVWTN